MALQRSGPNDGQNIVFYPLHAAGRALVWFVFNRAHIQGNKNECAWPCYLVLQGLKAGPVSPKEPTSYLEGKRHNWGQERMARGCPISSREMQGRGNRHGPAGPALGPGDSACRLRQREEGKAFWAPERALQTPGNHNEPSTFIAQQGKRFQRLF